MQRTPSLVLPVLFALLLGARPFAQASPGVGDVKLLPGDAVTGLAGGIQQFPAVAAGEGRYLAVWEDHRGLPETLQTAVGTLELCGQIVDAAGAPLGALPFRIAATPGRKEDVRVAFHAGQWLVTWQNIVSTTFSSASALHAARVALDGTVLDDPPLEIRSYVSSKHVVHAIAADAFGWAIVVQGAHGSESAVESYRVAPDGSLTAGSSGILPATTAYTSFALAASDTGFLFAAGASGVQVRRLSSALATVGSAVQLAGAGTENVSVASDGTNYLVAWERDFNGYTVQSRTVSAAGALGATTTLPKVWIEDAFGPSAVWTGNDYAIAATTRLFVWPAGTTHDVRVTRLTAGGTVVGGVGTDLGQGSAPRDAVASSLGDGVVEVVWRDETTPPHLGDVFATRVSTAGVEPAVALSTSTPRHADPDVAAGAEGYLAVFTSERGGAVSILAQRVDRFGQALDAEPVELDSGATLGLPRVAWNGSHFLVVWQDEVVPEFVTDDVVRGRRLAADGTPIDAAPFFVMQGATPDVEALGGTFLVAARRADTTQIFRVYAVRVDAAGSVLDSPITVGGNYARFPSVAALADRWIVAWQRNPTHDNPAASVFARVVLPGGGTLGEVFVDAGPRPVVAASGDVALVTWGTGDVWGQRLATDGKQLGVPFLVASAPGSQSRPSAAWDGTAFLVAWLDGRHQTSSVDERLDLFANRVTASGVLLDGPAGFAVASSPEDERMVSVAARQGDGLVAFGLLEPEAPHATRRAATVRVGHWTSLGGGVAGAAGVPLLAGTGLLTSGGTVELAISGAAPASPGGIVLGVSKLDLPLFGGVFVPSPDAIVPVSTAAGGSAVVTLPVPSGYPVGLPLWAQAWILDAGAPAGLAGTNALTQVGQ